MSQDGRLCRDTALGAAGARVGARTGAGAPRRGSAGRWGRQALGVRLGAGSANGRAGAGGRAGSRRSEARGAQAGARARGVRQEGRRHGARGRQALGEQPGRLGWPWAVHSVHSACFWPGSTRYFPESKFLDIVREPGS